MKLGRHARFAGRGRVRSWWLLLAVVLAAVLWVTAQVLGWPVWARAVLAGLAATVPLIVAELRAWFGQGDTRARLVEQGVAVSGGYSRLPRVRAVGLDQLRVHAAQVQVPYIERDQQDKLEEAVGPGKAALVVGHSMSGKTRLAAEVVKRKFPDAALIAVESGKALRELVDGGLNPAGVVVWLDDLERFLGTDGLTVGLLNRLTTGGAIVVATIRVEQRETYRPQSELWPPEWEILQRFSEISLQRRLTGLELGRVRGTVNDPGVLAAVDHYGLAEYLGAGPEALDKFEKGEIANPVGQALVRAAVDWRRVGLTRPVSQQVLTTSLPTYLTDRPDVPRTKQAIAEGLAWATRKINETIALLGQVFASSDEPVFEAFDYLIDQLIRTSTPVPDPMWFFALEQAESAELRAVGLAAEQAGELTVAETAWRRAVEEGDPKTAPISAVLLGSLLHNRLGNLEGAIAVYQRAIDSFTPLEIDAASVKETKDAYQWAIYVAHATATLWAAYGLGRALRDLGNLKDAIATFQWVSDSGEAPVASLAAIDLGALLREAGDIEGARTAYQQARDCDDAELASIAACGLAQVLSELGNLEGAIAAYQQASDSGEAPVASLAAFNLGVLLGEAGDIEGAEAAYQRAIDSGDAELAAGAAYNLGRLLEKRGDMERAEAAYQRAIDSGHPDHTSEAAVNFERLLRSTPPPATS
jgi:tetratricopeptide (TPR) repeat protein